jgi:hypothetical protein
MTIPYVKTSSDSALFLRKGIENLGLPGQSSWNFSASKQWTNSLTGISLPGFRRLIEDGSPATTPLQADEVSVINIPVEFDLQYSVVAGSHATVYQHRATGSWSVTTSLPAAIGVDSIDTTVLTDAQTKWNSKVFDTVTAFQGGVFLAELRETLHLITSPGKSLRDSLTYYLSNLKKGKKGMSRKRLLEVLSESWLEYVFGVLPLLNDIRDATSLLDRRKKILEHEYVRVSAQAEGWSSPTFTTITEGTNTSGIKYQIMKKRGATCRYSGAVRSSCDNPTSILLDSAGFSPRNWAPTVWEVIPWSFVIDYFSNIGVIVESWSNQTLSIAWASLTTRKFRNEDLVGCWWTGAGRTLGSVWSNSFSPGYYHATRKSVTRAAVTSFPIPSLAFKLPGFSTKWLNLAALALARRELNFKNFV